ncbi:MAG: ABC transporter permease, partial [Candidatus Aminicenantes bacterium]|nr:ABC transporter permease [Candidatus Aminicenantes bacterium]
PDEQIMLSSQMVDEHFLDTYKIKLIAGRNFSNEYPTDATESIIMNETAIKRLGWEANPLDQQIERYTDVGLVSTKKWRVVGVVKDYHFQSFHEPISPMVLYNNPLYMPSFSLISVRLSPEDIQNSIAFLKTKWAEFDSVYPFEFDFVDNRFNELYRSEQRLQQLFGIFTILAVIIGCLGLFGLTSFTAEQRTREIGIRKVLGASVKGIIWMQVRDFTKWVLLAIVVAWPLGYFVMNKWLQNFAYRTSLSLPVFIYSACLALIISILTVSYQTVKAALTDPGIAIKYE